MEKQSYKNVSNVDQKIIDDNVRITVPNDASPNDSAENDSVQRTTPTINLPYLTQIESKVEEKEDTLEERELKRKNVTVLGLSGLQNIGNTCYMNAVIQCISSMKYFTACMINENIYEREFYSHLFSNVTQNLADDKRKKQKLEDDAEVTISGHERNTKCVCSVTGQLQKLLKTMWNGNNIVVPKTFKYTLGIKNEIYRGFSQNDSQETLNFILDSIHEECKTSAEIDGQHVDPKIKTFMGIHNNLLKAINKNKNPEEQIIQRAELDKYTMDNYWEFINYGAIKYWAKHIKLNYSLVTELLNGLFCSTVTCKQCGTKNPSFELYNMIPVEIPQDGESTLENCLKHFVSDENLNTENDNQFHCEKCDCKTNAVKSMSIWNVSPIVIIQLKRFKQDGMRLTKSKFKVTFPINKLSFDDILNEHNSSRGNDYELTGIVQHMGTLNSGHYRAYTKNSINNKWYIFDDSSVAHIPESEIEGEMITDNAYLLFYQKIIKNN